MDYNTIINKSIFTSVTSFNCRSLKRSIDGVRALCRTTDILALQETWLLPHDISLLGSIDQEFSYTGKSAVDTSKGMLRGRSYGGVAILWRKSAFQSVSVVECASDRLAAIKIRLEDRHLLMITVYMPTDCRDNLAEFTDCMSEVSAVIDSCGIDSVFILGDFNADPKQLFGRELKNFCVEQKWLCADVDFFGSTSDTYTYLSDVHGTCSWLDHVVTTEAALSTISDIKINYDVTWSDHFPVEIICNFNTLQPKIDSPRPSYNNTIWGERDSSQIKQYTQLCSSMLRDVDFPPIFRKCADYVCDDVVHRRVIDTMYIKIVKILGSAAASSCLNKSNSGNNRKKRPHVIGWNLHVKKAHGEARLWFTEWVAYGKPSYGSLYDGMRDSRREFKAKLKWCQDHQIQIKMDILASHHSAKNFGKFWKETNKINPKPCVPVSVEGNSDPVQIANLFRDNFRVKSPLGSSSSESDIRLVQAGDVINIISAKEVARVVKGMKRGKSPGHDSLSIEHLKHAGPHLPRVLAMLFTFCIGHSYLPEEMMRTLVVPIIKNKTGDASSLGNYRPISLATIIAKVLDGVIDNHLSHKLSLHDAQFGFRAGLSTESAILSLKHTVRYYTSRNTPVYACFLDLSKAFDLVAYDRLWPKLSCDTELPPELIMLLKYWYGNQSNVVKWAGSLSTEYRLECGVRQGGISSPRIFNLYMDRLIHELSGTGIGCSIDGKTVNNISYADDMVLLSPSISALRKLLKLCESYAEAHGLRYNASKSELMVFKAGSKTYSAVPSVSLAGTELKKVAEFKYLGHWVSETLSDDLDIERERRALSVRANMLARRFARCSRAVKLSLFRAYCQSFYTCSLWVNYTQKCWNALRVQYNNAFRVLLGLPRFCSASGMFAESRVDDFYAIIRNRTASLMRRVRGGTSSYLNVIAGRLDTDCAFMKHWTHIHNIMRL